MGRLLKVASVVAAAFVLAACVGLASPADNAQAKTYKFKDSKSYATVYVRGVKSGKVTYKKKTNTLTLKNVKISKKGSDYGSYAIDSSEKKLTIVLKGKNTMKLRNIEAIGGYSVTLKGSGSLTMSGSMFSGIHCSSSGSKTQKYGVLTLDGPKVTIKAPDGTDGEAAGVYCTAMKVKKGSLSVTSPDGVGIECAGWSYGYRTKLKHGGGNLTMSGGKVSVTDALESAVKCSGGTISVGKKASLSAYSADACEYEGGLRVGTDSYSYRNYSRSWGGGLSVSGTLGASDISCGRLSVSGTLGVGSISDVTSISGSGSVTVCNKEGDGIHTDSLRISGCRVTCSGCKGNGIDVNDLTVSGGTVTCNGNGDDGISAMWGDGMTVAGGTVTCSGNDGYGIDAWCNVTVSDGAVTCNGNAYDGIEAWGDVVISGGTVACGNNRVDGISSLDNLTISGGAVTCSNNGYDGICAKPEDDSKLNLTASGGTVTCNDNGEYGIYIYGDFKIGAKGKVTLKGNKEGAYDCDDTFSNSGTLITS